MSPAVEPVVVIFLVPVVPSSALGVPEPVVEPSLALMVPVRVVRSVMEEAPQWVLVVKNMKHYTDTHLSLVCTECTNYNHSNHNNRNVWFG